MRAADEVVEFLARQIPARALAEFSPSETTRRRVWELVHQEKESGLPPEERAELDDYERLEHLLILTRAKARAQASCG